MSLFGQAAGNTSGGLGGSLFGGPTQNQQAGATGGGLFGQSTTQNQQQAGTTGGGLFGGLGANKPATGGLFGQQQQQAQPQTGTTGGLFGQSTTQQPATTGMGLFGQPAQGTPTPTTGGLFGNQQQQQTQQKPSLFGASMAQPAATGFSTAKPSLFGATNTTQQQPQMNSALGGSTMVPGGSLFASQGAGLMGGSLFAGPTSGGQSQAQSQPAGAYFDSLFAKSQKAEGKTNTEDLPSLELGLGDLRHRLRKLQAKPNEKPLDGKAHYLLAASGVDPGNAAKDLGMLDVQGGRVEQATRGYAPNEVDVETYLSNLQTKTTLSMIADGLDRSVRDFDNFLEDNVTMEWEAQRKRIYQHFGIKPREETTAPGREAQSGFGRSKRSKAQGSTPRSGKASVLGRSTMQRSVIGNPSRIGAHQSDFSDVDRSSESSGMLDGRVSSDDRVLRERQGRLSEKIRTLNTARLLKRPYPILSELAAVERKSHDPHAPHVVEAYLAVMEIVGENPEAETTLGNATAKEREFAPIYLDENPNSSNSVEMRKRILTGANKFLEKQFLREVESLIAKHPHEAKLGGLPDIVSKIKAYIRLRSARKDLVPDNTELQQTPSGEYVWAIVFYLLRSGHINEAAKYVNDNQQPFKSIDRTFPTYLNNYAASEDRRISGRKMIDRCTNEYIQRSRNAPDNTIDPFRMACYKVIGRIELSNRNLEGLNTDINDWIWLQFNLAREGDKTIEMAGESYGLAELQSSIREIGLKHFPKANSEDSNGSFGMFFYLQILSGMFEDAIAYLYPFSYVDAVHFGLALAFYGLLRPSDAVSPSNDLRSYSTKNLPQINFGRMIGYYTRDFRAADVVSAVDYLTLICLNQDLGGEAGQRHGSLCHEALRELVLETREFSKLIGDIRPDGRRIRGIIEERGSLMGLDAEDDFVNTVTLQAASFADENGRTTDSVLLYHLAGEYDTVVAIVSRALSEAISLEIGEDPMRLMPVKPRAGGQEAEAGSSLSLAAIDDPVELAKTMMSMYERDAMFYRRIQDQNKVACRVLLEMSSIKSLVEVGQWAQCLDKIRGLEILPLDAVGDASLIRAYASKFSGLSQPVSINVPNLLMWTIICCVRQKEQLTNGQFSGNEGTRRMMVEQLKQMTLDLTTYTSQLRYRFPPHLHEALARASAE
ncbi:Nup93/Nic96-domain-containing protein [Ilyonectria robusta]|uniref:Nup93/Nic96-domain-containing protein n=1 Tax=Ilyonectria robusta TaxID=1079257 RepID=UPI001E8D98F2|nr:Nup93/Nic96-domain-containing protein [Ilyonectria robusta]KAH8714169.1 Nup93/Nic96-domain-containing protein [Ilyonectria robusta]